MLHKRLYTLLTILEAVLLLQASDWIYMLVMGRAMGRWDLVLPADCSKRLWVMPCAMVVLTNVVGWYLLRRDDWRALRLQESPSFRGSSDLVREGAAAGIVYALVVDCASDGPPPWVPSSLLWLWDGDGTRVEPSVGTACHQYCHDLTSEQEGDDDVAGRYRQG